MASRFEILFSDDDSYVYKGKMDYYTFTRSRPVA